MYFIAIFQDFQRCFLCFRQICALWYTCAYMDKFYLELLRCRCITRVSDPKKFNHIFTSPGSSNNSHFGEQRDASPNVGGSFCPSDAHNHSRGLVRLNIMAIKISI